MNDMVRIQKWLTDHQMEDVEAFVPDMAGAARGKVLPADKFGMGELKLPEGISPRQCQGRMSTTKTTSKTGTCCCGLIQIRCGRCPGLPIVLRRCSWIASIVTVIP